MKLFIFVWASVLLHAIPVSAALLGEDEPPAVPSVRIAAAFPRSQYTPHGYLDNPFHSMVRNRSGVIRSVPPLGFGFWAADFKGAYGSGTGGHVNYLSLLNFAISIDGKNFITPKDFDGAGFSSAYHTKHMLSYDWSVGACTFSIKYFLPREHTLSAIVEIENSAPTAKTAAVNAIHTYAIGGAKWWGSNGLSASYNGGADRSISKIWAYGDVFTLGSSSRSTAHMVMPDAQEVEHWIRDSPGTRTDQASVAGRGPIHSVQRYEIAIPPRSTRSMLVCLSRGKNGEWAMRELDTALATSRAALDGQLALDDAFWKNCPVLEGDWDDHWKRGWVYDFETLRMNVRRPIGIFTRPWDAMQVHSPRSVLGEMSLDMMTLSYADPGLAQDVILGTFADAIAPNVPCVREDGSVNMVSSDGSECGTAPMWGYPFHMIKNIFLATNDREWMRKLYPSLRSYIEWWLEHRTDSEGWLHCNNSWESGQDGSRRFLVAEHNEAAVADFVRTVDVEASMAEAMLVMKYFAGLLKNDEDVRYWESLSRQRIQNTRSMFSGKWFRDVDSRSKRPIVLNDYYDVAMLAPLTCGIASAEQIDSIRPMLWKFEKGHEWPPGLFTFAEAAVYAQEPGLAAGGVAFTADRVYRRTDARSVMFFDSTFSYRIPGVANEFWPEQDVPAGGENYGWGATLPMNIIRSIIGFREREGDGCEFYLAPALPKNFLAPGRRYTIRNMRYRRMRFDVTYEVKNTGILSVAVRFTSGGHVNASVRTGAGAPVSLQNGAVDRSVVAFAGENERTYIVRCE